ncbi:MAG: hypothetical protein ACXW30_03835 [Micavibrio sp.]
MEDALFFSKEEIKRNLLGGLEIALLMPSGAKRFGNNYDEAIRSFVIPILLFPLTLGALYMFPVAEIAGASKNTITLLFSLRLAFSWAMFFGIIYWLMRHVDHLDNFYRFVVAANWLSVPATVVFLPVAWMLLSGTFTWEELYPFMMFLVFYTYAFTAFMAVHVLIIPWELAGFIAFIAMTVDDSTIDIIHWIGSILG